MRLIDADALIDEALERYCKDCDKRKCVKNGKYRIVYEIGEAPCRACEVDDVKAELEEAPTIDAVPVVRCKDCKHYQFADNRAFGMPVKMCEWFRFEDVDDYDFCSRAERRTNR